jgi:transposase
MLDMLDIEYIRKLYHVQGWSIRQIAKRLGHSRNTIAKYLGVEEVRPRYRFQAPRPRPVLGAFEGVIRQWLEDDEGRPRKQRHTAHRIYVRLRDEYGFPGGESTIRLYVRRCKKPVPEAYLPLEYALGVEAQCDFGAAEVVLGGRKVVVQLFCLRLMASHRSFVMAFPHQKAEAFYEGHRQGFEFFGGVPRQIRYDNPKVAVTEVLGGRERKESPGFIALRSHYLFESVFCTPGKQGAHEKGGVENLVGYVRRNFLVPVPEVEELSALNAALRARCLTEGQRQLPGDQGFFRDLWAKEQAYLLPLPERPFACCRTVSAVVNSLQLVTFERCRYSVPTAYVGQTVTLHAYVDHLEISHGDTLIASHPRLYEYEQESLQMEHYLELLDRRPGAVANARVFRHLAAPYQAFRQRCLEKRPPAVREFLGVLKLHREFPQPIVACAIGEALARDHCRADVVRQICQRLTEPERPAPLRDTPVSGPVLTSIAHFDQLLRGEAR